MNIVHLPDEMLYAISNKLNINDALYSLIDVNERFDRLICDPLFIRSLDLTAKSPFDKISPLDKPLLNKICKRVLPQVNEKVTKMIIEPTTIGQILETVDYPQLRSLSLIDFQQETILQHLTGIFFF